MYLIDDSSRLREMQQSQEKQDTPTSSVLYGIIHFISCLQQFVQSPNLDARLTVQMERPDISFLPFLCFQQIMKNSKFILCLFGILI